MVMHRSDNLLFHEGDLEATLRRHFDKIVDKVDGIPKDQLLATPEDDLVEHIYSEFEVLPITLNEDAKEMEEHEIKIDISDFPDRNLFREPGPIYVPGVSIVVNIPYTGDHVLWNLRPNQGLSGFPRANIRQSHSHSYIEILVEQPIDDPPERIKQYIESELENINSCLSAQKTFIEGLNSSAPEKIRKAIKARKERLKTHEGIAESLGIPLKRRGDAPSIEPISMKRLVRPLPPPPKSGFKPEPGISEQDFEHILSIIRHEGRTFEATPKTYSIHDEEGLRDILLAHLNGHYEGSATGETFRRSGKTDIRIEDQNRAAFVAECKIWRGSKELLEAVDQLLGYLTWRDCKVAIILFNKHNAKFTELLTKVPETLRSHPKFKKDISGRGDGEWRLTFTSFEDDLRQVIVNVFVFNLYVA